VIRDEVEKKVCAAGLLSKCWLWASTTITLSDELQNLVRAMGVIFANGAGKSPSRMMR
jgi:hypothetical protein